jgi:hypothetical protein
MTAIRKALAALLSAIGSGASWLADRVRPPVTPQGGGGSGPILPK